MSVIRADVDVKSLLCAVGRKGVVPVTLQSSVSDLSRLGVIELVVPLSHVQSLR